jgi:hypothetical protein
VHVVTELPVPIRLSLPPGWQPAHPDDIGMPQAAFAAVLTETLGPGFTTNLIVYGELLNEEITEDGFADMADESVHTFRHTAREVMVAARTNTGSAESPSLVQILRFVADVDGAAREMVQFQLYANVGRWERPRRSAIVRANLTCAADQFDTMAEDFGSFCQSLAPSLPSPSALPVPIRFDLPGGWEPISPDTSDAAFTAMKTATHDSSVTPAIRLHGQFRDDGPVGMADEFLRGLPESQRDEVLAGRQYGGSPEHPCLIQTVSEWVIVDGVPRELVKVQAYETVGRSADQRRAAVVLATLTCADNQVESVFDDFLSFFDSIAAEPPTTS